ncbi:nucleoprotein TPR-like [Argonauta hians]
MDKLRSNLSDCKWLDTLDENIVSQLESFITSLETKADEWKSKFEVLRCTCEQQYFELEKQLITTNSQLEAQNESSKELNEKFEDIEKKFNESSSKLKEVQAELENYITLETQLSKSNKVLESEKKEIAILLEKRTKEVDRLNGECKELSEKFSEANKAKSEALAKVEEFRSQDIVAKYQKERFSEEIKQLKNQVSYLNGELEKKITDQQNIVKNKTAEFLKVQSELNMKIDETTLLKKNIESLTSVQNKQKTKIEEFNQKLKDARDDQIKVELQFHKELQSQTKLVTLYKGLSEDSETKIKELSHAVSELQNLLKEASEGRTKLEAAKDLEKNKYIQQLEEKDKKIKNIESELRNANDLLSKSKLGGSELSSESVASLLPTAAATSKLLKSGMTLTQIYNEYVQAIDEIQLEKEENKRLKSYLDQIMQEIEEKAPILRQQREDYEQAVHTITQLTHKLDSAMLEGQKLRNETEETRRHMTFTQKEIKRLTQQTSDLGRQVQYLLREIEELRGGHVATDEEVSSTEVTSSSQLISERLVTFKSVQELQVQNQRLLEVVRKLSEDRESEEQAASDAKSQELKQSLDNAMEELEELKSSRTRQEELVESIIRQRDMYRVLYQELTQTSNVHSTPMRGHGRGGYRGRGKYPHTPQSAPAAPFQPFSPNKDKEAEDMKMALHELQTEYATYKREKGENDKMLNSQLDKLRGEVSDLRVQNTKLASQLEFATERYKVLQNNSECYRKEIGILKEQNKKSSAQSVDLEKNISVLHSDLVTAQVNVSRLESRCQNLVTERDLLKAAEQRLAQEKENMLKEQHSQNVLLSNLQTIQNNMERVENETKSRLIHQADVKEKELTNLKRKAENMETEYKATIKALDSKISNIQRQHDQEIQSHQKSKDTIIEMTRKSNTQKQELAATQAKLACAETKLSKSYGNTEVSSNVTALQLNIDGESLAVKDLRSQLNDSQTEIKSLKEQLEKSRKHVDQYKAISESLENSLKDHNKASENFNQNAEKKLETLKEANESKAKIIEELEKEKKYLSDDNTKLSEEKHKMIADLRKQLSSLQNELQEAIQSRKTAVANEQSAREGCDTQVKLAAEAQDKYQRELILHAADMEALAALKKDSSDFTKRLETATKEAEQNLKTLNEAKVSWAEQERILKSESSQIEGRCNDLLQQNNILHEQLAQLSTQVAHIQKSAEASNALNTSMEEKEKSSDQLLEVIRFLRKEKEISVARVEVADAETMRMKQRFESLQKQYEEACKNLSEEREHSQVSVHTAAQHADLMRKVENLNVFTESNAMLRQEKDRLEQQVKELTSKVKKLEEDIEPLQLNLRELTFHKENLVTEKNNLNGEVERWKARTNRLIEQCNKADPEEHRKIVQEREELKKQISVINEENMKKKRELNGVKTEAGKKDMEIENLRTQIEQMAQDNGVKDKDLEDKAKTISQLKKIGRKYKEQAEETARQLNELREAQQSTGSADTSKPDQAASDNNEIIEQLKKKIAEAEKKQKETEEAKSKLEQQLNESKESENQLKSKTQEMETNQNKFKSLLQSARIRLTSQKEQLEKMTAEMNEQKKQVENLDKVKTESVLRENSIKSQYESRLSNLERELEEARRAVSAAPAAGDLKQIQKENAELQAKVQQIQKQLEVKQKQQPSSSRTSTPAASADRLSLPVGEAPKMANIKPMTSTTPAPVRQTAVQHASAAAAAKATASIKPMAIASTTASPVSATTPTATVMPTTITTQEPHEGVTDSPPSALSQISSTSVPLTNRPVQQIQRVTPQIELIQDSTLSVTPTSVAQIQPVDVEYSPMLVIASSSTVTSTPGSVVLVSSSSTSTNSSLSVTSTSSSQEGENNDIEQPTVSAASMQSQAQQMQASTSQSIKRPRDDVDVQDDNSQVKRSKSSQVPSASSVPVITVTDGQNHTIILESADSQRGQESNLNVETGQPVQAGELDDVVRVEEDVDIHDDDDDNDDDEDEDGDEDNDETEVEDVIDTSPTNLELTQPYTISAPVDDEVVIVDDDDDEEEEDDDNEDVDDAGNDGDQQIEAPSEDIQPTPTPDQPTSCQVTSSPSTVSSGQHSTSQLPLMASQTDRLAPSAGSGGRSQLIPFMFQGPSGTFEEGDDCTVPSTPTLFVPRRGDGFAEAVSYPQVPQRFVFGSGEGASHSELETQGALGMDDTRMDLSQFDDGQVRNIPYTSHQVTATSGGSATVVFSHFAVTPSPPQQLLQGDCTTKETAAAAAAKEGTSAASVSDAPKHEMTSEDMVSRTVREGAAISSSVEQVLPSTSEDFAANSSADPQGLRKSKIQPIVWDQSSGSGQPQPTPTAPLQQNPASTSTIATPSTSAAVPPGKGRAEYSWASGTPPTAPSSGTSPSPSPAATSTTRGGMIYNTRGVRCSPNTRGRGAIVRGHATRSPVTRGHAGRARGPASRGRGRGLRRKN